jgi:hypothetical protein
MAGPVHALVAAIDDLEAIDLSPVLRSVMPRFFAHRDYFAALPLKIEGGSGSPLRPVAFVPKR